MQILLVRTRIDAESAAGRREGQTPGARTPADRRCGRVFKPGMDPDWIVGIVAPWLMFSRIGFAPCDIPVKFETGSLHTARWLECEDSVIEAPQLGPSAMAEDHDGANLPRPKCMASETAEKVAGD